MLRDMFEERGDGEGVSLALIFHRLFFGGRGGQEFCLSPPRPRAEWEEAIIASGIPGEDEFGGLRDAGNALDDGEWEWPKQTGSSMCGRHA